MKYKLLFDFIIWLIDVAIGGILMGVGIQKVLYDMPLTGCVMIITGVIWQRAWKGDVVLYQEWKSEKIREMSDER